MMSDDDRLRQMLRAVLSNTHVETTDDDDSFDMDLSSDDGTVPLPPPIFHGAIDPDHLVHTSKR